MWPKHPGSHSILVCDITRERNTNLFAFIDFFWYLVKTDHVQVAETVCLCLNPFVLWCSLITMKLGVSRIRVPYYGSEMTVVELVGVRHVPIWVRWAILHWIRRFEKVNVNNVNIFYGNVLILVASCSFRCILSLYWHMNLSALLNRVKKTEPKGQRKKAITRPS